MRSPPFYCTSLFSVYLLLDEDGDEAPLEDPLDAEPDESLTPKAASVCRSS